jgi:hypothetical protein
VQGRCRVYGKELAFTTLQFGEGGMSFVTSVRLPVGAPADVELFLPGTGAPVRAGGRILRVEEKDGRFEAAMRFLDIAPADRVRLASCVPGPRGQ